MQWLLEVIHDYG